MNIIQSIILGLAQGAGEFLPISSSGHLVIIPWLFNFKDPGLAFDVALHWGTLIAVLAFFWKDWVRLVKSLFLYKDKSDALKQDRKLVLLIIIASIPGALFGYLFDDWAESAFRAPLLIALTLLLMGLVLDWADRKGKKVRDLGTVGIKDSVLIGLSQAVAIIPGVSRSGATISTALFRGLNRYSAARFSFLLSAPIIFGAGVVKLPDLVKSGITAPLLIGMAVAAISGFISIKLLLKLVSAKNYRPFVWYRVVLAVLIVIVYILKK